VTSQQKKLLSLLNKMSKLIYRQYLPRVSFSYKYVFFNKICHFSSNYQYIEFYRYMMMKWRQLMSSLHCLRTALSRILYWFFIIIKHFKKNVFSSGKTLGIHSLQIDLLILFTKLNILFVLFWINKMWWDKGAALAVLYVWWFERTMYFVWWLSSDMTQILRPESLMYVWLERSQHSLWFIQISSIWTRFMVRERTFSWTRNKSNKKCPKRGMFSDNYL